MPVLRNSIEITLRAAVALACCLGIWGSLLLARADYQFRKDTADSIRLAIDLVPDGWPYYMRLAQFDSADAKKLLNTSLRFNPYDAQADIELGLENEAEGNYDTAEKQLLQAYKIDHTYMPRWSLANFYFRQGNMPEFWTWARSAADMPSDDIGGLFELCWRASPDPKTISEAILNQKPEFLRQYVHFLLAKDQTQAAEQVARNLFRVGDQQSDLPVMLYAVNHLVEGNHPTEAFSLWHLLIQHGWVEADWTFPNNAHFLRTPLRAKFDWSLREYPGLHSWPGPSGLDTEFNGSEPEDCVVAEQYVVLNPGDYRLTSQYHTSNIRPSTGLSWQVLEPQSQKVLGQSNDLSSEQPAQLEIPFTVEPGSSLVLLRLRYRRSLGTVRITGTLNTTGVQIHAGS